MDTFKNIDYLFKKILYNFKNNIPVCLKMLNKKDLVYFDYNLKTFLIKEEIISIYKIYLNKYLTEFEVKNKDKYDNSHKLNKIFKEFEKNSKFEVTLNDNKLKKDLENIENYILNINLKNNLSRVSQILSLLSLLYIKQFKNNVYTNYFNSTDIQQIFTTKREIFYSNIALFNNMKNVDYVINTVCSIFAVSRYELNIFPSSKGLYFCNFNIVDSISSKVLNLLNNVNLITSNLISDHNFILNKFNSLYKDEDILCVEYILIVEKDTLFQNLINNDYFKSVYFSTESVIITAKGYPDYITRMFIKKLITSINSNRLEKNLETPVSILYFGDYDSYGIDIYLNYCYGSINSCYDNKLLSIDGIKWMGLNSNQVLDNKDFNNIINCFEEDNKDYYEDEEFKYENDVLDNYSEFFENKDISANNNNNIEKVKNKEIFKINSLLIHPALKNIEEFTKIIDNKVMQINELENKYNIIMDKNISNQISDDLLNDIDKCSISKFKISNDIYNFDNQYYDFKLNLYNDSNLSSQNNLIFLKKNIIMKKYSLFYDLCNLSSLDCLIKELSLMSSNLKKCEAEVVIQKNIALFLDIINVNILNIKYKN